MKDANKLLNQMGRRMATDKFLMFFVVAMILLILGILISRALGLDKPNVPEGVVYVGGEYLVVDCSVMVQHPACKNAKPAQTAQPPPGTRSLLHGRQRGLRQQALKWHVTNQHQSINSKNTEAYM